MLEYNDPWWRQYRRQKYKPRIRLNNEMILRKSIRDSSMEYVKNSSLTIVKGLFEKNILTLQRLARVALLIAMISWTSIYLHYMWVAVLGTPLVVSTESDSFSIAEVDFPAVAICDINRISKKAALEYAEKFVLPKLGPHYNMIDPHHALPYIMELGRLIDFSLDSNVQYTDSDSIFHVLDDDPYDVANLMAKLSPKCEDLLAGCIWAGEQWDCMSIFDVRRTFRGHCCVFNYVLDTNLAMKKPNASVRQIKRQAVPGHWSGLLVTLNNDLEDYAYPLYYVDGIEVVLFDPTKYPEANSGGSVVQAYVQPGEVTILGLKSVKQVAADEVRKRGLASRKCLFKNERVEEYGEMYSYSTCIMKCRVRAMQSLCKCTPYFFPVGEADGPMCTLEDLLCLNRYREKFMYLYPANAETEVGLESEVQDSLFCPECFPDCEFTKHNVALTKLPFHFPSDVDHYYANVLAFHNHTTESAILIYQVGSDAVLDRLDVVAYWFELLSNVGGEVGILIGLSMISCMEILYFSTIRLFQLIVWNYKKYH